MWRGIKPDFLQEWFWLRWRGQVLGENGGDEGTRGPFPFRSSYVYTIQAIEI